MQQESSYGPSEKLKQKAVINTLFKNGTSFSKDKIRVVYVKTQRIYPTQPNNVGVSVSKRNFKKATDRNKIKRLLREVYRKNKYLVLLNNDNHYDLMLLYVGRSIPTYKNLTIAMQGVFRKMT